MCGKNYGANIRKLADAPSFCYTASPQVGSDWHGAKHAYGLKFDILDTTKEYPKPEEMLIAWLKCKSGPKCGENI